MKINRTCNIESLISVLFLMICIVFLPNAAQAEVGPYDSVIQNAYIEALACANKEAAQGYLPSWKGKFDGWCGLYVRLQLDVLGIGHVPGGALGNGRDVYGNLSADATTSTGYKQIKYPGNNCLYNIVDDYGNTVENVVISFDHQYGYSSANPGAGHVVFIYGIIDNVVYFSESYSSSGYGFTEGTPVKLSLSAFMSRYNGNNGEAIGAVVFDNGSITRPRKNILSGVYVIHSAWDDNICLDIAGDSTENNANIQLYHRVYNDVQKFRVIKWDDRYYCIKSIYNGRWLDAASPIGDNSNVKLFNDNSYDEDYWYFEDAEDGYVYIRNKTGYYLDVQGDSGVDHANVQLYHFVGNESQKWRLEDVTDYYSLEDGIYAVHSALDNGYRLDISGDSMENRANIQLYKQTDSAVQLFRFTNKGSYYVVQSMYSNKWLDVHMPIGNNANVQLWEDNTAAEEHWFLEDAGDGYVCMRSGRDYYLDVQGSEAKNNANVQVYRFLGDNAQKWKIAKEKPNVTITAGTSIKETVIMWDAMAGAQSYGIQIIDNDDNYVHVRWNYDKTAFSALLPEGEYRARIIAVKGSYNSDGDYIPFTVTKAYASDIGEAYVHTIWNNALYNVYKKNCTWLEAKQLAESNGGKLAIITSLEENDIIASLVEDAGIRAWIGAEGYSRYFWVNVDGQELSYTNWDSSQPDNDQGLENCCEIMTNGKWNDASNSATHVHGFVAEFSPVSISVKPSDELLSLLNVDYEQEMNERIAYYTDHIRENLTVQVVFSDGTTVAVEDYNVNTWIEHSDDKPLVYGFNFKVTYGDLSDTSEININLNPLPVYGQPDLTLPAVIESVDEAAFEGIAATIVYIPDTCTSIGKWSFKDCAKLTQIRIPEKCAIGTDAFSGCSNVVIFGTKGSAAETYANSHSNCTFVAE